MKEKKEIRLRKPRLRCSEGGERGNCSGKHSVRLADGRRYDNGL